jgi:hypothetical protein
MAEIDEHIAAFENELGLPNGFYDRLLKEDDWSFVIKLHALLESSVNHVLARRLGEAALEGVFALVELANKRSGKLAFARVLDALSASERRYISELSELRNTLVHNVSNVSFSFREYIASLDQSQRTKFVEGFGYGIRDPVEFSGVAAPRNSFVLENPKFSIWLTGMQCVGSLYLERELALLRQNSAKFQKELLVKYMAQVMLANSTPIV